MSIVEFRGGPVTMRYLERKTKTELARMYLDALKLMGRDQERIRLAAAVLDGVYDGPETPNGSAIAEAMAILEGDPNAIAEQKRSPGNPWRTCDSDHMPEKNDED